MPQHRCDERTIDYSQADQGVIRCGTCGRRWDLDEKLGWIMSPREPAPPRAR